MTAPPRTVLRVIHTEAATLREYWRQRAEFVRVYGSERGRDEWRSARRARGADRRRDAARIYLRRAAELGRHNGFSLRQLLAFDPEGES